jgi:uncharacterized protein involved in exopolysaccharide biosynthesis
MDGATGRSRSVKAAEGIEAQRESVMHPTFVSRPEASVNGSLLPGARLPPNSRAPMDEITLPEKAVRLLRNRWWVILQAVIVVPTAALALSLAQHKSWTATTTMAVQPATQNSGSIDATRQAATEAAIVGLPVVAQRTAQALGHGWTRIAVHNAIAITSSPDDNLVGVSATASTPTSAAALANAYANAFLGIQDQSNLAAVQRSLRVYDDYLNSLPASQRNGPRGLRLQQRLDSLRINQALQTNSQEPTARIVQAA